MIILELMTRLCSVLKAYFLWLIPLPKDKSTYWHPTITISVTHSYVTTQRIFYNTPLSDGCRKPTIPHGKVFPDALISSGNRYQVTCDDDFELSGPSKVSCTDGVLSELPTCERGKGNLLSHVSTILGVFICHDQRFFHMEISQGISPQKL